MGDEMRFVGSAVTSAGALPACVVVPGQRPERVEVGDVVAVFVEERWRAVKVAAAVSGRDEVTVEWTTHALAPASFAAVRRFDEVREIEEAR